MVSFLAIIIFVRLVIWVFNIKFDDLFARTWTYLYITHFSFPDTIFTTLFYVSDTRTDDPASTRWEEKSYDHYHQRLTNMQLEDHDYYGHRHPNPILEALNCIPMGLY